MKKNLIALAVLLATSAVSMGQTAGNPASSISKKAVTLSGEISNDGKSFLGSSDELWTISNPATVAGHEGQQVTVKCQISADKSAIHVFVLKPTVTEAKYVTRHSDSAFRR